MATKKQRKEELKRKLSPDYMKNMTTVFDKRFIGSKDLDEKTLEEVYRRYTMYFNSWVKNDLEELLK